MQPQLADCLHFYEQDTLSFVENNRFDVDLLFTFNHLQHINPVAVSRIQTEIYEHWKPKMIIFREWVIHSSHSVGNYPTWQHDFSSDRAGYELVGQIPMFYREGALFLWSLKTL
jgi:hypothetical protein